jgi:IS5 family transposase
MENRNGLAVNARVTKATGTAEREAAVDMLSELPGNSRITVGADKAYDTKDFVKKTRSMGVTPHIAQNTKNRASAIDNRTTRHAGYPTGKDAYWSIGKTKTSTLISPASRGPTL